MKTQEFLEGLNEVIDKHLTREGVKSGMRYFSNTLNHVDTSYGDDHAFVQNLNKLMQDYFEGDYYQKLIRTREGYARRTKKS